MQISTLTSGVRILAAMFPNRLLPVTMSQYTARPRCPLGLCAGACKFFAVMTSWAQDYICLKPGDTLVKPPKRCTGKVDA